MMTRDEIALKFMHQIIGDEQLRQKVLKQAAFEALETSTAVPSQQSTFARAAYALADGYLAAGTDTHPAATGAPPSEKKAAPTSQPADFEREVDRLFVAADALFETVTKRGTKVASEHVARMKGVVDGLSERLRGL